jgi:hypothetical protein
MNCYVLQDAGLSHSYFEEANKLKVNSFLERVRSSATAQTRTLRKKHMLTSSVVAETAYYQPMELEEMDLSFLEPKRGLRPRPMQRVPHAMHVEKIQLLVQVVGGRNVPLRSEGSSGTRSKSSASAGAGGGAGGRRGASNNDSSNADMPALDEAKFNDLGRIRTVVEIKFQEYELSTTSVSGAAPLWKQSLAFPFRYVLSFLVAPQYFIVSFA